MLGDTLRVLRTQKGMTQEQLAAAVGLSPQSIRYYEENTWRPGAEVVSRLAEALRVPIEELIGHDCKIISDDNGTTRYIQCKGGRTTVLASCRKHSDIGGQSAGG